MKKYLIATAVGGLMEMPNFEFHDFETIEANSEKEALDIYNKKHNLSYFTGAIMESESKMKKRS